MVNYGSSPFDKLTAAPYVSQYVGNTLDAERATFDRLQARYDAGEALQNQVSKIAKAIPLAPEDEHMRTQMESYYNDLLKSYAERGDYHRLLPRIQSEAATIESMYKAATSQYEKYLKQQEAINKTKASDLVKADYLKSMYTGDSKFEPGVGFRFGRIGSSLPTDMQDLTKIALDSASKVETFVKSVGFIQTREQTKKKLQELGLPASDAILEQLDEKTIRDPKKVRAVVYSALMTNPEVRQFIQQEAGATSRAIPADQLDATLAAYKVPAEVSFNLSEEAKRALLAEKISDEKVTNTIAVAEGATAGTLSVKYKESLTNIQWDNSSPGGPRSTMPGLVVEGSGLAVVQDTWNFQDWAAGIGTTKAQLSKARTPAEKKLLQEKLDREENFFKNMLTGYIKTSDHADLVKELKSSRNPYNSARNSIENFYKAARQAGLAGFSEIPRDPNTKQILWEAALDRILYSASPEWLDESSGGKGKKLLVEAADKFFSGAIGERIQTVVTRGKEQVSLAPQTLDGGIFTPANEYLTSLVRQNQGNFGLIEKLSGTGEYEYGQDLNTFLEGARQKYKGSHDVDNYKIRMFKDDFGQGPGVMAVVLPGKNGHQEIVRPIGSKGSMPLGEVNALIAEQVAKLESKAARTPDGTPVFETEAENRNYSLGLGKVVESIYKTELDALMQMRDTGALKMSTVLPAGRDFSQRVPAVIERVLDTDDPDSGSYIYRITVTGKTATKVLEAPTPRDVMYKYHKFIQSLEDVK